MDESAERRRQGLQWLEGWRTAGERLERERWERVQALDDDTAWDEAQALFALVEPGWLGDAGEGLILQQQVLRRGRGRL